MEIDTIERGAFGNAGRLISTTAGGKTLSYQANAAGSGQRFRYTGQQLIGGLGLYYARRACTHLRWGGSCRLIRLGMRNRTFELGLVKGCQHDIELCQVTGLRRIVDIPGFFREHPLSTSIARSIDGEKWH